MIPQTATPQTATPQAATSNTAITDTAISDTIGGLVVQHGPALRQIGIRDRRCHRSRRPDPR